MALRVLFFGEEREIPIDKLCRFGWIMSCMLEMGETYLEKWVADIQEIVAVGEERL